MPIDYPKPPSSVSSLSSSASSSSSFDSEAEEALVQAEWEESMRNLEMLVSIVLLPFIGKYYGRRSAIWAYARYKTFGLTRAFFGLS